MTAWSGEDPPGGPLGTDGDVLVSRSTDDGVTWSDPEALKFNSYTDNVLDHVPWIAADSNRNWMLAFDSYDNLGGPVGPDKDILISLWSYDCDPRDLDSDGFTECDDDCDDAVAAIYPGAPELCDGYRNDCNDGAWPTPPANESDADLDAFDQQVSDLVDQYVAEQLNLVDQWIIPDPPEVKKWKEKHDL